MCRFHEVLFVLTQCYLHKDFIRVGVHFVESQRSFALVVNKIINITV